MRLLIKALLMLLPFLAIGQNKTYLGVEVGPKFEIYDYTDNGDGLYTKPFFFSPIWGVTLGQELNQTFMLETGFYVNDYGESFRIEGDWGASYSASNAILAFQVPARLKARINLLKDKLSIVPSVGFTLAINNDYESSGAGSSFTTSSNPQFNDSTRTEYISNYNLQRIYGLVEGGIGLEYKFKNSMIMYLSGSYLAGFKPVVDLDVTYRINDEPAQTANVFSDGSYYNVVVGLKYPISNLWSD
jgi:hypothetical protein